MFDWNVAGIDTDTYHDMKNKENEKPEKSDEAPDEGQGQGS